MKLRLPVIISVCIFAGLTTTAHAATRTWDAGAGTTDWLNATNWSADTLPTSADTAQINLASGATVTSAGAVAAAVQIGTTNGGTGALTVSSGVTLATTSGTIGNTAGSNGTATVTGAGSTWTNSAGLIVGSNGTGALNIQNTAAVSSTTATIGSTATGVGNLNIQSGGTLSGNGTATIGNAAGASGVATVNGSGSTWANLATLIVGSSGTGALNVQNAGSVSNTTGTIGSVAGSSGTAIVTGSGSRWTNSSNLNIASSGTGSLSIQSGGVVSNGAGTIAANAGSAGTATVDGSGSTWTNSGGLIIGSNGTGTLNIQNTAAVSSTTATIGSTATGVGNLNIQSGGTLSGNGTATIGNAAGASGVATVNGSGSTWTNSSNLIVASTGTGSLSIQSGGVVSNVAGTIASNAGSAGTATVDGSGSTWTNSAGLIVGSNGTGALNIQNTGTVSGTSVTVGSAATGVGTLNIQSGGTLSTTAANNIGNASGSSGTATVDGAGSRWTGTSSMAVGISGTGTLNIQNGGVVSMNNTASIGFNAGSSGTATVDGTGSRWTSSSTFFVGYSGTGSITVSNGAAVSAGTAFTVGRNTGGVGTLLIQSGGTVTNAQGELSYNGGNGTATVTGAGSSWTNTSNILVGATGTGTLNVQNGGTVSVVGYGSIGGNAGSTGTATVTDAGSRWSTTGALTIGSLGTGTLTLTNGGTVTVSGGTATIANSAGSVGTLNIGDAVGNAAAAPGTLSASTVAFGSGTGTLNFNHTSGAYTFASNITGAGTINFQAGTTILTGDMSAFTGTITGSSAFKLASGASLLSVASNSSGYSGATDVTDATLKVNGSLGGTTTVGSNGRLQGSGTLGTVTAGNGSTVAPGNSIGTLTVATATFNAGSTYEVEINSAGQSDLLDVTGAATINAGTVSVIPFPDVALNTQYTILNAAGGLTGTFTGLTLNGVAGSYLFVAPSLSYDANHVYLTLASDPGGFEAVAHTPNQKAAAREAAHLPFSNGAASALFAMTEESVARDAFDQLAGEIHASALGATLQGQQAVRDSILAAINEAPAGDSRRAWLRSYGTIAHTRASDEGNTATLASRTGGSFVGIERREEDGRLYGFALGASEQELNQDSRHAQGNVDSTHAAVYGGMELPGSAIALRGGIGASLHQIGTKREMAFTSFNETSSGDYGARSGQLFLEASRTLPIAPGTRLRPRAAASYSLTHADSFDEDGQAGLHSDEQTDSVAATELGITIEHRLNVPAQDPSSSLAPRLTGGLTWRHQIGDLTPSRDIRFIQASSTSTGSAVQGAPLAADSLSINAGLSLDLAPNLALTADYQATAAPQSTQHTLAGKLAYRF